MDYLGTKSESFSTAGTFATKYNDDQRRIERAALYPQLEAVATYGYTKQSPETLISGDGQFDQIGVEMNWNLLMGRTQQKYTKGYSRYPAC